MIIPKIEPPQKTTRSVSLRRRWVLPVLLSGLAVIVVAALLVGPYLSPLIRERMIQALRNSYESDVALKSLDVRLFPWLHVSGEGLVLRFQGRTDLPPLISIAKFTADATWLQLMRSPTRVGRVRLEGLQIHIPPRHDGASGPKSSKKDVPPFIINEVDADGTILETLPKKPGKQPLRFDIHQLTIWNAGSAGPMSFRAKLTNAKPIGEIDSEGQFGPWNKDEPSLTPVAGKYGFEHADLSIFHGISGILSSQGTYEGVLEEIRARGTTDTPDFRVTISDNPVHLKTQFNASIDGTDGDTRLEPVIARFGHSTVTANGTVEGTTDIKGKTVTLDVTVSEGRLEDMLRLGVKSDHPIMTGAIAFHAKLVLPPGDRDVIDKLRLDGQFSTASAHFTKPSVQDKVNELSNRGSGNPEASDEGRVSSNFRGSFSLKDGTMSFQKLAFAVPGAEISLNGTYGLSSQQMDFHGTANLEAKLSETTTGIKSFLLKAVDPFFKGKHTGSSIPIKITGTKDSPSFGLDLAGGK